MAPLHLIVFARTPVPGRVKTRLIGRLTAERAARLHEAMIADTAALVAGLPLEATRRLLFSEAPPAMVVPPGLEVAQQASGELGARLAAALADSFSRGAKAALVLGSDTPHLPAERIMQAASALAGSDVVLGPAEDGGFYLLGCRAARFTPRLFDGLEWGTGRVLEQTRASARAAGLSVALLEPWYDLDEWPDLLRLLRQPAAAPHTTEYLASII